MTEVLFYHLERQPLDRVLPVLLQKTLERGWRAVVRCGVPERIRPLSDAVWTWREESFIPHGTAEDGNAEHQPVWITGGAENPNGASILFCVEGARPEAEELTAMERVIIMFSGHDPEAVEAARGMWREWKDWEGLELTYWRQDPRGRWERQA